jgi:hypothetical protein
MGGNMQRKRFTWLVSLVAIFALVCGLGLAGCSAGGGKQTKGKGATQEVVADDSGDVLDDALDGTSPDEGLSEGSDAPGGAEDVELDADTDQSDPTEGDQSGGQESSQEGFDEAGTEAIDEAGEYTSKDEVALYLHTFGHLPSNYVTKREAEAAGWKTKGLDLWEACPGKSIGGDRFGNREGRLPKASGRTWYECDIDYTGSRSRNAKRILYSDDGLIYYTEDHYNTFEQLY